MKSRIITTIPVYNGEAFIARTLASVARQTLRPDRVIVCDDGSKDRTEEIVRAFKDLPCEFLRNPVNRGLNHNFNRCLEFAAETDFLQILHADDTISPDCYATLTAALGEGDHTGLAWALDERIDENDQHLSVSGRADGSVREVDRDTFLKRKAELANHAFCATLMKTNGKPTPVKFQIDALIVADQMFWGAFGAQADKRVFVNRVLGQYRWHGSNSTSNFAPTIQSLVLDEWRAMEMNELLRGKGWTWFRQLKLKGLFAVRSGIKSRRLRANGNVKYAGDVVAATRNITGGALWFAAQILVGARDFYLYTLLGRRKHPKNLYG